MAVDRRTLIKGVAAAGAGALLCPEFAEARERKLAPPDAVGMLYDATRCIGCKACVVACKEANGLPPDTFTTPEGREKLWDAPSDLNAYTKNIIKVCSEGDKTSYVKAQCMHCLDPACVGACMIGALQKRDFGIVTWDGTLCVGCRYCQVVCPFSVPRFEWAKAVPKIVKCELCLHRLKQGKIPGCCEVCPRQAVIFGKYPDLVQEAKGRLAANPERYEPKVYGEKDGGGTQVLYLSKAGIGFDKLGLPNLGDEPVPEVAQTVQHGVYKGFIAPAVLFVILGGVVWRNKKTAAAEEEAKP